MEIDEGMSIRDAAAVLGISENALRLRLNRGQLATVDYVACKDERGRWRIVILHGDETDDRGDRHSRDNVETMSPPVIAPGQLQQIAVIRDQWIAPYVARLEARAEEVGRLSAELVAARAEVDRLQAEIDATRAVQRSVWWRRRRARAGDE